MRPGKQRTGAIGTRSRSRRRIDMFIRADEVTVGICVRLKGYRTQVRRSDGTLSFETPILTGVVEEVVRITETEMGFVIGGKPVAIYPAHELIELVEPNS